MTSLATFWAKVEKTDAALLRIAAALEQIAKTLEAIRSQCQPRTVHLDGGFHDFSGDITEAIRRQPVDGGAR